VSSTEQQLEAYSRARHYYAEALATAGECIHVRVADAAERVADAAERLEQTVRRAQWWSSRDDRPGADDGRSG
jgi:wobble nucleotide-excising tRNase